MTARIVVTGATGKVGRDIAERLAAAGVEQRLLVRDPSRAPRLPGAEVVQADYRDPESVREALYPGDRVFMVATHEGVEDRIDSHRSFIQAAADVGVGLVAYLSMVNASRDSKFPHSWSHRATEELLEASPVPHAFLRMNLFLDDLPLWFDADGVSRGPARAPTTSPAGSRWAASRGTRRPAPGATWRSPPASWASRPASCSASPAAS